MSATPSPKASPVSPDPASSAVLRGAAPSVLPLLPGFPRLWLRTTPSTNDAARRWALAGAPDGALVTAFDQTVGRGQRGHTWSSPPGLGLPASFILRPTDCPAAQANIWAVYGAMTALAALREMYNQKGSSLPTDEDGLAYRGIIVRHLVLPGQVENSLGVLDTLADISLNLHISLMAQYYPPLPNLPDQLGRTLTPDEYQQVVDHLNALGLSRGWVQELDAQANYRPDFTHQQAF